MAPALTLVLLACLPPDLQPWPGHLDADQDGVPAIDDCDDEDPRAYPGAEQDFCGNAIDEDCDGADETCRLSGELTAPDDCTHADDAGFPVAVTDDLDGDGVADVALGGGGGDFGLLVLHRVSDQGVAPAFDADPWAIPAFSGVPERFGWALPAQPAGDLTGDGSPDLLVGAPDRVDAEQRLHGGAFVLFGSFFEGSEWGGQSYTVTGGPYDQIGSAGTLATGDFDGDGQQDATFGAPAWSPGTEPGSVVVLYGPIDADRDLQQSLGEPVLRLDGLVPGDQLGDPLSTMPDLDGDGADELLAATRGNDSSPEEVYLVALGAEPRPTGEAAITAMPHVRIAGPLFDTGGHPENRLPLVPLGVADLDGDGLADLVLGAPLDAPLEASGPGAVHLFSGASLVEALETTADLAFEDAAGRITGEDDGDRFGQALAATDVDGDGLQDLVVGAPGRSADEGGAYLVHAWEWASADNAADLATRIVAPNGSHSLGGGVAGGDVTGDGFGDVLVATSPHGWHSAWLLGGGPGTGTAGLTCE